MYVVCYLIPDGIHPEDSEIRISGVCQDKVEAEELAEVVPAIYEARVYKANYYTKNNKHKEK